MPANSNNEQQAQTNSLTLRDIYLDLPKNISKILVEAGITSLLNCIETQKKMVLSAHYLTSKLSSTVLVSQPSNSQNSQDYENLIDQICDIFKNKYLKEEILHNEKNTKLFSEVIECVNNFEPKLENFQENLKNIVKFLKTGSKGSSNHLNNSMRSVLDTLSPSDDMNNFKDYYKLGDVDIIDEAEDIATHLMNEVIIYLF